MQQNLMPKVGNATKLKDQFWKCNKSQRQNLETCNKTERQILEMCNKTERQILEMCNKTECLLVREKGTFLAFLH